MSRSFDETAFNSALSSATTNIYALATKTYTPMFRMRRYLRGVVPIKYRRLIIAAALSSSQDTLWPIDT